MCLLPHACLQARKIAWGNNCQFEMLFVQFVVAVEILMRQEYHNLDSALDLIEEFQNTRNGRQQLFIDSERGRDFSG